MQVMATKWWMGVAGAIAATIVVFSAAPALLAAPAQQEADGSVLTDEALANATYSVEMSESGAATLVDGQYSEPVADTDTQTLVWLLEPRARGDLDGDGVEDAVVLLAVNGGGSGNFVYLSAVLNDQGAPANVSNLLLGDRVDVQSVEITADGVILVDMVQQGPDDPMCCPTQHVLKTFELVDNELVLIAEEQLAPLENGTASQIESTAEPLVTAEAEATSEPEATSQPETTTDLATTEDATEPAVTEAPNIDAEPTSGSLNMGGPGFWLDPALISVISGAEQGAGVAAESLGEGCLGMIATAPDVVVNWRSDPTVDALHFFLLSRSDPTLTVVTPGGDVLCNDDLNALSLDPYVVVQNPVPGRYALFVGHSDEDAAGPALLVVTQSALNPLTMDMSNFLPRAVDPMAKAPMLPESVLQRTLRSAPDSVAASDLPMTMTVNAGGALGAWGIELGNPECTGFVDPAATYRFTWDGDGDLRLFVEAAQDATLVVRGPDGAFQCSDDVAGADNLNPLLDLATGAGEYAVWVGSFAPDVKIDGTLTLTNDSAQAPAVLTADMLAPTLAE